MSLEITEELIARQTPEAQAIIRALLATIRQLQDQLNQSPRNSSVPPSTEHTHAPPLPSRELIALRVLEALERSESPEAREVISELARGTPDSRLTWEAKASLRRLEKQSVIKP
jgi:hypothetical protein